MKLLTLKPYRNLSGSISWRVTGTIHGERIRKNFKDRLDALNGKRALELRAMQGAAGLRPTATFLSEQQLRKAEAAFARIQDLPHPLEFYLDYALTHYKPVSSKTLADAKADYIQRREEDRNKGLLVDVSLIGIKSSMNQLVKMYPEMLLAELDAEKITRYCESNNVANKTHNTRRDVLSSFLKFAMEKEWISKNPIDKVPRYDITHKRGSAAALTAEQARKLMEHLETYEDGKLVPLYALCLFAGIRPDVVRGEIFKLPAKDIHLETGVIHIEPDVSKVKMKRIITIQPNLVAWLRAYPLDKYPIIIPKIEEHKKNIADKFGLSHDILRHTFISMHVAKFRSMGDTALQAGNSETIIRKHYLNIKSSTEAEKFWEIMPEKKVEGEMQSDTAQASIKSTEASAAAAMPEALTAAVAA